MSYRYARVIFALLAVLAVPSLSVHAQQTDPATFPYMNRSLPIDQRIDDLIGRMTLEEKVSQMRDHAAAIPRLPGLALPRRKGRPARPRQGGERGRRHAGNAAAGAA